MHGVRFGVANMEFNSFLRLCLLTQKAKTFLISEAASSAKWQTICCLTGNSLFMSSLIKRRVAPPDIVATKRSIYEMKTPWRSPFTDISQ